MQALAKLMPPTAAESTQAIVPSGVSTTMVAPTIAMAQSTVIAFGLEMAPEVVKLTTRTCTPLMYVWR